MTDKKLTDNEIIKALECCSNDLSFGDRLRAVRKARGLKQRELAAKIGVTAGQISEYERGARTPGITILEWLCKGLGVSASDLLGF